MDGLDLKQAVSNLLHIRAEPARALGCRLSLVSFVWVDTFCHHWPSQASVEHLALRAQFMFLKDAERSRFLKQRRIVLRHLVREAERTCA